MCVCEREGEGEREGVYIGIMWERANPFTCGNVY